MFDRYSCSVRQLLGPSRTWMCHWQGPGRASQEAIYRIDPIEAGIANKHKAPELFRVGLLCMAIMCTDNKRMVGLVPNKVMSIRVPPTLYFILPSCRLARLGLSQAPRSAMKVKPRTSTQNSSLLNSDWSRDDAICYSLPRWEKYAHFDARHISRNNLFLSKRRGLLQCTGKDRCMSIYS